MENGKADSRAKGLRARVDRESRPGLSRCMERRGVEKRGAGSLWRRISRSRSSRTCFGEIGAGFRYGCEKGWGMCDGREKVKAQGRVDEAFEGWMRDDEELMKADWRILTCNHYLLFQARGDL